MTILKSSFLKMGKSLFILFICLCQAVVLVCAENEHYTKNNSDGEDLKTENKATQLAFATGQYGSELAVNIGRDVPGDAAEQDRYGTAGSSHRRPGGPTDRRPGKRILIVDCLMDGSHTHIQRMMARELASRGHNVTWLSIDMLLYWPTKQDREQITFVEIETSLTREMQQKSMAFWTRKGLNGELSSFTWYAKMWLGFAEDEVNLIFDSMKLLLQDLLRKTDFEQLRAANFELVMCEVMLPVCSSIAHDILKVPFINTINGGYLGTRYSRWFKQHSPLSYVPEFVTGYTDVMTFPQRVKNVLTHAMSLVIYDYVLFAAVDRERALLGIGDGTGTRELMSKSELFIYNWDFSIEFPRPVTPNVVMIGGLTLGPTKPLSKAFADFIQGSGEHGVVVFSVSTLLHVMDMDMANMIAAALARLPQRVIWKYLGEEKPASLGNNTMAVSWISQKDLIAHEKTRLLIYHGGLNGGYEAMYYGVPILGLPLFTDQVDDLVRLKHRLGMANYFPNGVRGLTSEKLYQGIKEVLGNPTYRANAKRVSNMLRDLIESTGGGGDWQGTPMQQTAGWIEYVMEHGTEHLRTKEQQLTWYQRWLLDVVLVFVSPILVFIWLLAKCCCRKRHQMQ